MEELNEALEKNELHEDHADCCHDDACCCHDDHDDDCHCHDDHDDDCHCHDEHDDDCHCHDEHCCCDSHEENSKKKKHSHCSCCDDCDDDDEEEDENIKEKIIKLSLSAVLLVLALVSEHISAVPSFVTFILSAASYLILGLEVLIRAAKNIARGKVFNEVFLMSVSTLGAFVIGEYPEGAAVMLFYQLGELLEDLAVDKSRDSVTELMDIRPDSATVMKNSEWVTVNPEEVQINDLILVKPGEKIPLDGVVESGNSSLDTRALTGESVPRNTAEGEEVLSGCVNLSSPITVRVTKSFGQSTAAKVLDLVENAASSKAKTENIISRFAKIYTPIVVFLALAVAIIPSIITGNWALWVYRGLVTLVVSCPCALVVSVPLTYFAGIGAASRDGMLIKGSTYLEALAEVKAVAFDKTGTLTKGVFNVTEIHPEEGIDSDKLMMYAASCEYYSSHPIAKSLLKKYTESGNTVSEESISEYTDISGHGVSATIGSTKVLCGSRRLLSGNGIESAAADSAGSVVYVAADGKYIGYIIISDEIKNDSEKTVRTLRESGCSVTMLTGDRKEGAEKAAASLGIDDFRSGLLPQGKVEAIEDLISTSGGAVVFVGDGINDAPVLARADVGVAMGGLGSDAAIEAADAVLMTDEPSALCKGISIAKKVRKIVLENISFSLLVKAVIIVLGWLGIASMWMAVFGDVGVLLLVVANSLRVLKK